MSTSTAIDRDSRASRGRYDDDRRRRSRSRHGDERDDSRRSSSRYVEDSGRSRSRYQDRADRSRSRHDDRRDDDRRSRSRHDRPAEESNKKDDRPAGASVVELLQKAINNAASMTGTGNAFTTGAGFGLMNSMSGATALNKVHRELYLGGVPPGVNATQVRDFFNLVATQAGIARTPGPVVLNCRMADNGAFAFIELRSMEETDAVVNQLQGIPFLSGHLKIGRPKGYTGPPMALMPTLGGGGEGVASLLASAVGGGSGGRTALGALGLTSTNAGLVSSGPTAQRQDNSPTDYILVSNMPPALNAEQLSEIMSPFGSLDVCHIMPASGDSDTASALIKYADASVVDTVVAALNGLDLATHTLALARAPRHVVASVELSLGATKVLELSNVVVVEDLSSEEEVTEIREEVAEECGKYGQVLSAYIPPLTTAQRTIGQEKASVSVYVEMASIEDAVAVAKALKGRRFDNRLVKVTYASEALFQSVQSSAPIGESPPAKDEETMEDLGLEGGGREAFASVGISPPAGLNSSADNGGVGQGGPEDGLTLPSVPPAADLD